MPSYGKSWELLQEAMCDVASNGDEDATNRKLIGSSLVVSTSPFLPVRLLVTARVIFARSEALLLFFSISLSAGGRPMGSGESCSRGALLLPTPSPALPRKALSSSSCCTPKGCMPSLVHWAVLRFLFQRPASRIECSVIWSCYCNARSARLRLLKL